ncbi:MAG: hypothetical protein AAGJ35_03075 [Myxococcota bacterium]
MVLRQFTWSCLFCILWGCQASFEDAPSTHPQSPTRKIPENIPQQPLTDPSSSSAQPEFILNLGPKQPFVLSTQGDLGSNAGATHQTFSARIQDCPAKYSGLDWGLYWYGRQKRCEKFVGGPSYRFYDPEKPTLIFVHGWQRNSVNKRNRETFDDRARQGPPIDMADIWLDRGWNIGILYWNQFADEGEVKHAEAKIWSASGPRLLRWRKEDGSYGNSGVVQQSLGEQFAALYRKALRNQRHDDVRLAGHSLGSQMVLAIGKALLDRKRDNKRRERIKLPQRIVLLDPAFLRNRRSYLQNRKTSELSQEAAESLRKAGVVLETYRSSGAVSNPFVGDANERLLKRTAFTELKPHYFSFWQFPEKHTVAKWHYFWSLAFPPPTVENVSRPGPSASATLADIRYWMESPQKLEQVRGKNTRTPNDDILRSRRK